MDSQATMESLGTAMFQNEEVLDKQKVYKEFEFKPPGSREPIVFGYVSEGSNLKHSFLNLYFKHRALWNFNKGIVFIAKKIVTEDNDNRKMSYRRYDNNRGDKWSVILFDVDTFLAMYRNGLAAHSKHTLNKSQTLVQQWNDLNHNDDEMGERHEVGYEYVLDSLSFAKNRIQHRSELVFSLSTWAKTQAENWESFPTAELHDIMVCVCY